MPVYFPGLTFGGLGYGGASYGYSPYGSGSFPRLPVPVDGGYGGASYGLASYGSVDITPPRVTGANSLDGFRVEVFFSEDMKDTPALVDTASYTFTDLYGVAISPVLVEKGTPSGLGYSSVILTHEGSTLGGQYLLEVTGPEDVAGNPMSPPTNKASFFAFGDDTTANVYLPVPDDGRSVRVDFLNSLGNPQDILTEAEFSPGVEDSSSYEIDTTYPLVPTIGSIVQDPTLLSRVDLDVHPMTSANYDLVLGPSLSIDYNGSLLPDDDPSISGSEIGVGSSVASGLGLIISKPDLAQTYGWSFGDITGRMVVGTSYRADFVFNTLGTTISPAVTNTTLGTFSVSDGVIQINVGIAASVGLGVLEVTSGAFSSQLPANWDDASEHTISVVRNQKGDFYSVLFDGTPLITFPIASATGPATYTAGTAFVLSASHSVNLFRIPRVGLTSSLTLFTDAWNFIHGLTVPFVGSSVLSRDKIITKYGPLVRGWGDNTPATKNDVEVRIDGGAIDIAGVNPYVGEIYPTVPIPLAAAGTFSVEVDYIWFRKPAMELVGLNTRGLTLNTWDRSTGHTAGVPSPVPSSSTGTVKTNRFSMGVALGPYNRETPKQIGHKYIGFQKNGYSALLNQDETLLLNQNPHAVSVGSLTADAIKASGLFDGQTSPPNAATPWTLDGSDAGGVNGDGTYTVWDNSTGPYGIGEASVYYRELDLSLDTQVTEIGRFKIESYTADGVFTGAAFGIHDGARLVMVGALEVDGVKHVGVLLDGTKSHLEEGWEVGPSVEGEASSKTTILLPYSQTPTGILPGQRFRIPEGPQAGVYQIDECGLSVVEDPVRGLEIEIVFTPELPVDPDLFGAKEVEVIFETLWDEYLTSFRLYSRFPEGETTVYINGLMSGVLATVEQGDIATLPAPVETALLLPATEKGVAFWGSISRRAESKAAWDIVQYNSEPERLTQTVQGVLVSQSTSSIPEDPWYEVGGFGLSTNDAATGTKILLSGSSAPPQNSSLPTQYFFEKVEPHLSTKGVSLEATFDLSVDSGILGAGNTSFRIRTKSKETTLTTLLYAENASERFLVPVRPHVSLSGIQSPTDAGWTANSSNNVTEPFVRGQTLELSKSSSQSGRWENTADFESSIKDEGMIIESRVAFTSGVVGTRGVGLSVGGFCFIGSGSVRVINVTFDAGVVQLRDRLYNVVAAFPFASISDGDLHVYRVVCDPNADIVVLSVDDTVLGSTPFTGFSSSSSSGVYLGSRLAFVGDGEFEAVLDSLSVVPLRQVAAGSVLTVGRTLAIPKRVSATGAPFDAEDIDSYAIPRTDGTPNVLNSSLLSSVQQIDWSTTTSCRLFLDPNWGILFYWISVGAPLPPTAPVGSDPSTSTDPNVAWISVEYNDVASISDQLVGTVAFGSIDANAITRSLWGPSDITYRLRAYPQSGFGIAPQNMVLNRAFTLTSGEYNLDTTPEVATIVSRTPFLVNVGDSGIYADRVFVVQVAGSVVSPSLYSFNKSTQSLQFDSTFPLPEDQYPVTVTFVVAKPATQKYLCDQPIEETVTVLNEGTPVVPASEDYSEDKYAGVEFCTTEDGEDVHISTICDSEGITELELPVASFTTESYTAPSTSSAYAAPPWVSSTPGTSLLKSPHTGVGSPGTWLTTGGGAALPVSAVLNQTVLTPTLPPSTGPGSCFALNQEIALLLENTVPYEDLYDIQSTITDNEPPNGAGPTPNGNGAAAYTLEDYAGNDISLLGPWSPTALQNHSLLGGGAALQDSNFILEGGNPIDFTPTITTGTIRAAN